MADGSRDDDLGPVISDRRSLDELYSLTYEELRRLASTIRGSDANATVNPTALVNEAWIKLASAPPAGALSRGHFKRIAARAMRQVLVDAARRRKSDKRGGGMPTVVFDEELHLGETGAGELLALDAALAELALLDSRQAAVIECRFFGGLEIKEAAETLGVSEATVLRDWRVARAWLSRRLSGSH